MATDFEKLNNALVTAAARGAPYSGINDGFQSEVAGNRWKESIPPLWSSMLNGYWTQYAAAYLVDRNKGGLPDPAVVAPGGLAQAVKDLYAPVKDSAGNLVAKTEAAVSAKLQQIKDAADAQLKQVGAKIAAGAQAKTQEWIWGLGGIALGMLLLWMLARESGAFGEQPQPMRRLPRDNRGRREQLALEAGVDFDNEDEAVEWATRAAERGKRRELKAALRKFKVGERVELHPGTDRWMMGDRYGEVAKIGTKFVSVKLDKSGKTLKFTADRLSHAGEHDFGEAEPGEAAE